MELSLRIQEFTPNLIKNLPHVVLKRNIYNTLIFYNICGLKNPFKILKFQNHIQSISWYYYIIFVEEHKFCNTTK